MAKILTQLCEQSSKKARLCKRTNDSNLINIWFKGEEMMSACEKLIKSILKHVNELINAKGR